MALTHAPCGEFFTASTRTPSKWTPSAAAATPLAPRRSSWYCPAQTLGHRASSWCSHCTCSTAAHADPGAAATRAATHTPERMKHRPQPPTCCAQRPLSRHGLEEPWGAAHPGTCRKGPAGPGPTQQAAVNCWPPAHTSLSGHAHQSSTQLPSLAQLDLGCSRGAPGERS